MFISKLVVGVGETAAFYTLRETYEHYGLGEVVNGVFTGSIVVRTRHICNLAQDADEAYAKAQVAAEMNMMPLLTSKAQMITEMRDITRASATERAARDAYVTQRQADDLARANERAAFIRATIADGKYPSGKYFELAFAAAPVAYIDWIATDTFSDDLAIELQVAVRAACAHLLLPTALPDAVLGSVGDKVSVAVTVTRTGGYRSQYGYVNVVTMVTADGVCLVAKGVFTAEVGEKLTIKATVKSHDEYHGQAQTVVLRVKVIS